MRLTEKHREALSAVLDNITIVMGQETPPTPEVCERDGIDLPEIMYAEEAGGRGGAFEEAMARAGRLNLGAEAGANSVCAEAAPKA